MHRQVQVDAATAAAAARMSASSRSNKRKRTLSARVAVLDEHMRKEAQRRQLDALERDDVDDQEIGADADAEYKPLDDDSGKSTGMGQCVQKSAIVRCVLVATKKA